MHAYSVVATTLLSRRSAVREYLHGAYWVLPTLGIVIGLGAGALLSIIYVEPGSLIDKVMFQGTAGDARGVLIVVSATMITTTGIVFSLTVLYLQIASSQFSVRLLRTFLRDVPNQVVLAIFVCTFAYDTGGLLTVGEHAGGGEFVPKVAVTGSLALAFISIGALIYFLHHLVHSIRSTRSWKVSSAAHSRWWTISSQIRTHPTRNRWRRPNRRPEPSRCWHRSPATCKRWTLATSPIWPARRHTPCNSLCSSAITSPPAAVWAGAGAGVQLMTPPIPMCRNAFCGTCTSDSSGHSSRTSGSDYGRWWT